MTFFGGAGGGDVVGQARVVVSPDLSSFGPELAAKVEASLAAISGAGRRGATPLAEVEKGAGRAADAITRKLSPALAKLNASVATTGRSLSLAFTAPLAAVAGLSLRTFSNLQEQVSATNVAFRASGRAALGWAANLDDSFGLTQAGALETASTLGLLAGNFGLSNTAAEQLATTLAQRAADIGSLFNVPVAEVSQAIQSGLVGETRAVRRFGVDISEAAIKTEALAQGLQTTNGELSENQKFLVRSTLIMRQTASAQGDAARTAGTLAGQLRVIHARAGEAATAVGAALAPALAAAFGALNSLLEGFNALPAPIRSLVVGVGGIVAATGPALLLFAKLQTSLAAVRVALGLTAAATAATAGETAALGVAAEGATVGVAGLGGALSALATRFGPIAVTVGLLAGALVAIDQVAQRTMPSVDGLAGSLDNLAGTGSKTDKFKGQLSDLNDDVVRLGGQRNFDKISRGLDTIFRHIPVFKGLDPVERARQNVQAYADVIANLVAQGKVSDAQDQLEGLREQFTASAGSIGEAIRKGAEFDTTFKAVWATILASPLPALPHQLDAVSAAFTRNTAAISDALDAGRAQLDTAKALDDARGRERDAQRELDALRKRGAVDAEKVAAAEGALSDAADRVADANARITDSLGAQAEAQAKLDELLRPATEQELADARDRVTEAQLKLNRATRDAADALAALEPHEKSRLNLAGLTLDQLRATLANERATLQAQRATKGDKDRADLVDAATQAQIDQRRAVEGLAEATGALNDTEHRGQVETPAITAARKDLRDAEKGVADARKDATRAAGAQADAEQRLRTERAGDPGFNDQLARAITAVATAHDAVTASQVAQEVAAAKLRDTTDALAGRTHTEAEKLQEVFDVYKKFGLVVPDVAAAVDALIDKIAARLVIGTDATGRQVIKPSLVGGSLPGFASGGLVTSPTVARIGEMFRPELILPLSKPDRVWQLLSENLPRFNLPPPPPTLDVPAAVRGLAGGSGSSGRPSEQPMSAQQAEKMLALLEDIAEKVGVPTADVDITVNPTPGMSESQLARKVQRELQRYYGQ